MNPWTFTLNEYTPADTVLNGNRFLTGNGYMGCRGTMDEWGKAEMAAVNLAGVYDQNGDKWREPVNAPNGLFARLSVDGVEMVLGKTPEKAHSQTLDVRRGLFFRDTDFGSVRLKSERLVSMAGPHLMAARLTFNCAADARAELLCGIDTDIWDINGPHLFGHEYNADEILSVMARTGELDIPVAVAQAVACDFPHEERREIRDNGVYRRMSFAAQAGCEYVVSIFAAVYTGLDMEQGQCSHVRGEEKQVAAAPCLDAAKTAATQGEAGETSPCLRAAQACCEQARAAGFAQVLSAHEAAWENLWDHSHVEITGHDEAARAMNFSLYHLHSIAPRHADNLSIPARGLSGQTYKGAIFWDSEIFLFPVFVHT